MKIKIFRNHRSKKGVARVTITKYTTYWMASNTQTTLYKHLLHLHPIYKTTHGITITYHPIPGIEYRIHMHKYQIHHSKYIKGRSGPVLVSS